MSENISRIRDLLSKMESMESEYNAFFNLSLDMFCIASLDGHFTKVNNRWTEVLGWPASDLTSKPFMDFVHPEDFNKTSEAMVSLVNGGIVVDFINRYRTLHGDYRCVEWSAMKDPNRDVIYAAARLTDESNCS